MRLQLGLSTQQEHSAVDEHPRMQQSSEEDVSTQFITEYNIPLP